VSESPRPPGAQGGPRERPGAAGRFARTFGRGLVEAWPLLEKRFYVIWVAAVVAYVASVFVSAMFAQTGGEWSAPLDDTFIHFDYARSFGRGHPFHWARESGYSSGYTSLTYVVALAFGWMFGARGVGLMAWAVVLACIALVVFFVAAARYTNSLGPWAKYLLPPAVLSLGALDWALFSGMENAFFLGAWGVAALAYERFLRAAVTAGRLWGPAGQLSAVLSLLVLTRPEAVTCVAVFALAAVVAVRGRGAARAAGLFALIAGAPLATVLGQSLLNRLFTGEWAQAGAIAKLGFYDPYLTRHEMWLDWWQNFRHVVLQVTGHHFADKKWFGLLVPIAGLVPLVSPRTRARATILWAQVALWVGLISFNGQVRWQNERYAMSAVAWLLLLAAMGVGVLVSRYGETIRGRLAWGARLAVAATVVAVYWHHQRPRMHEQIWFFARASRNIKDQQLETGIRFSALKPRRIMVGDAGAIMYASDRPGLDLIGLGGYRDFPFARASRHGLGASIELIERMPENQRPDYMALYPDWWGDLPTVFGHYVGEVPVVGNVICAGPSKVIYRADWSSLEQTAAPRSLAEGESVIGELDVADLLSESSAKYRFSAPHIGHVVWRVLSDPSNKNRDLFDAGRVISQGHHERFELAMPPASGRLFVRSAASEVVDVRVVVAGMDVGALKLEPAQTWSEPSIDLPAGLPESATVELSAEHGTWVDYHVWVTQRP